MTSRSLNIINDTRNNLYAGQLRSNVVPIIELIGDKQAITNSTANSVEFTETVRQIGTENVNYVWPVRSTTIFLDPIFRWDFVKITVAGYYSFQFQYRLDIITEMYVTLNTYAQADVIVFYYDLVRYSTQLAPVNDEGVVTWTQYMNAGETVNISVNPAANANLIISDKMQAPSLTIVQLSQYYTDVIGKKSTIARSGGLSIVSGTSTKVTFSRTQGAAGNFSEPLAPTADYNQGGGNQLGLAEETYTSYTISSQPQEGIYYIEAQILMTGSTGVGTGGRFLMIQVSDIIDGTSARIIASQYVDSLNTASRYLNVSTVTYLNQYDIVTVWVRQTSSVSQTIQQGHFTIMRMG